MAGITQSQQRLVHVARRQIGLTEAEYRDTLKRVGVKSSSDLDSDQFKALVDVFKSLGFHQISPKRREGVANDGHLRKLIVLWKACTENPKNWQSALNSFCKSRFRVSNYRKLNPSQCNKAIEACKAMLDRRKK